MSSFETPLDVELISLCEDQHAWWVLSRPLVYYSSLLGEAIHVPRGFVTDFASVPRLPLVFLVAGDSAHAPAVVHDWLYTKALVSRARADAVFLEAMEVVGIPTLRRKAMYWAVRLFGGSHYGREA